MEEGLPVRQVTDQRPSRLGEGLCVCVGGGGVLGGVGLPAREVTDQRPRRLGEGVCVWWGWEGGKGCLQEQAGRGCVSGWGG